MFQRTSKKKGNILNYVFSHFEFVICFAPLSLEVERNIILDLGSTVDSVESKRGSGGTLTRRVCLCEVPHGSVVGATMFHDLGTLLSGYKFITGLKFSCIFEQYFHIVCQVWPNQEFLFV